MPIEDFKRIVESLRLAVAIADAKGAIVFSNAALGQLLGRSGKELAGMPLAELFAAGDQKRVQQNVERVAQGKAASAFVDAELARKAKSKAPQWVQAALQPALDARDKPAGVIAVLQDIGVQRETEEALNLLTARLLALTDAVPAALMIETAPGDVELVNDEFCSLLELGSAAQSLSGLSVQEVLARSRFVDPKTLERIGSHPQERASVAVTLPGGRVVTLERQPIAVEGEHAGAVWAPRAGEASAGGGPAPGGAKGAAEIALIEKIGEELSVALEGLSALSIRAQQMEVEPAIVEHFRNIRASTEAAMAAIGDLVDFSTLSGGVVLRKERFSLRFALAELIARLVPEAEERGCRLRIKVEQDVSDSLEGDVGRLQLVLKNLLANAFDAAPGGEAALQITPEYTTEGGIQLSFSVTATGGRAGAAADAGMGIAVARFMVGAMGGEIALGSKPGEALYGFSIAFPVRRAPPTPRRPTYVSLVGLTVLVVSADAQQRLALSSLLRGWRMVPLEADNASMALALLERMDQESSPVPLVILSNRLPVQDGFLLAFRIRHHRRLAPTLVMMLATEGKPGDAIACRENGIAAYMRYPINDRQLNEAIVAVTGASVDADETPTLVTRHSLREQRKGATLLLVDPSRDSQILAAHVLGRHDCAVVVAHDLAEANAALDQDFYDIVIVDTALEGLGADDAARMLRSRITRDAESVVLAAASAEHSPEFHAAKTAAGFDATLAKPFRKDDLLELLAVRGHEPAGAV
jgi:PAS domain S-box-containing protein